VPYFCKISSKEENKAGIRNPKQNKMIDPAAPYVEPGSSNGINNSLRRYFAITNKRLVRIAPLHTVLPF